MKKAVPSVFWAGLLVGSLDIMAAMIYFFIRTGNKDVLRVLKFVASGLFGKSATAGGAGMITAGFIFHYIIALSFTTIFFLIYPHLPFFQKNKLLAGILYGLFVWCIMNLIVVPLSRTGQRPFQLDNVIYNMMILIACIGIPLSWAVSKFYKKQQEKKVFA